MRHRVTKSEDSRVPVVPNADSRRQGIRTLDCGHELSQDGDLVIRRSGRTESASAPMHPEVSEDATSFGEQRQSV
jgi:hypothetical protein